MTEDSFSDNKFSLNRYDFQKEIAGKQTDLFILKNKNGLEVAITSYGASVVGMLVPDREGRLEDVVLGYSNIEEYQRVPEYCLGSVVGRYANRIGKSEIVLSGVTYKLTPNSNHGTLHGGKIGFNTVVWDVLYQDDQQIIFRYLSKDGEEGFPGNLSVELTYHLDDENNFKISYRGSTDKTTVLNLTQHSYFNLSGQGDSASQIISHLLMLHADYYLPVGCDFLPTGEIVNVKNSPMDFTDLHAIGDQINAVQLKHTSGYDHCYVLRKREPDELSFAARVIEPISGRKMEVYTTLPGMQLYTVSGLAGVEGKYGMDYRNRSAFCLEAQYFPDTPNKPHFPSVILHPWEEYRHTCIYKFGIEY